jgi:hypothetical protein
MPVRLVCAIVAGVAVRGYARPVWIMRGRLWPVRGRAWCAGRCGRYRAGAGNWRQYGAGVADWPCIVWPVWPVHGVAVRAGIDARDGKGRIFHCVFLQ